MERRIIANPGVAILAVATAFGLLELVLPSDAASSTYATASAAIALAALSSGLVAGLLAVALSLGVVVYAHLPPVGEINVASFTDQLGLALFALNGLAVAAIGASLRARRREPRLLATAPVEPHACHPPGRTGLLAESSKTTRWAASPACAAKGLVEPLTNRELEILALVTAGMSNEVVATTLCISTNTVKTHLKNIFGKLGVASRTQAVAQAHELGLNIQSSLSDGPTAA